MVQTSHTATGALFTGGKRFALARRALADLEDWACAERSHWPLWAPIALGGGIAAYFSLPTAQYWLAIIALALGVALFTWRWGAAGRMSAWCGLLIAAGVAVGWARAEIVRGPVLTGPPKARTMAGVIESREGLGDGRMRLILGSVSIAGLDSVQQPNKVRLTIRGKVSSRATLGAQIKVRALLMPPPGPAVPGGYDFARRVWFEGVGAVGVPLGPITVMQAAPRSRGIAARLQEMRDWVNGSLRSRIAGDPGGVAAALVTGDRAGLSPDLMEAVRASGLAHLLSISGLHIGLVAGGAFLLIRRCLCLWPWIALHWPVKALAALAAALAAIGYTLLSGASLPTVRSCIATLVVLAGVLIGRQAISLRLVAAGATVILLWRPEAWLNPSFQLSFAAVTGLVALYQSRFAERWLRGREEGRAKKLARWVAGLAVSGLVAEAMLSPIVIAHFNQTGVYGAVANLAAIPLMSFWVMPCLIGVLLAEPFGGFPPLTSALATGLDLLLYIAWNVSAWDGAVMRWPMLPDGAFAVIMLGLLWLCLWRTQARLLGIAVIAAGLGMAFSAPRPDMFVSADGRLMAIRLEDGSIAFNSLRAAKFARSSWQQSNGLPEDAAVSLVHGIDSSEVRRDCDDGLCRIGFKQEGQIWKVAWLGDWLSRGALVRLCNDSDIVVAPRSLPAACEPKMLRLDTKTLTASGAVALDLRPDRSVRVYSAANERGRHPWVTAAEQPIRP